MAKIKLPHREIFTIKKFYIKNTLLMYDIILIFLIEKKLINIEL